MEVLYKYVVPKPRSECTKPEQLVVTFAAGYIGKLKDLTFYKHSFQHTSVAFHIKSLFFKDF